MQDIDSIQHKTVTTDQPVVSGADQQQRQHMQHSAVSHQQLCLQQHASHLQQQVALAPGSSSNNVHSTDSSSTNVQAQAHGLLLNGLRLLELAKQLQDYAAQAAAAAEVAQQYESAGDASSAAASYVECLAACSTACAAGQGREQWLLQLLVRHVPPAVDVHLQLVSLRQAAHQCADVCVTWHDNVNRRSA
jgi:hypothetical protein